jgi:DGQHR domain-containing protein
MIQWIECPAFDVTQPVGTFYLAKISPDDLVYITFVDIRHIEKEGRDIERVIGIQRPLSKNRIKELQQYVNLSDATFPSSIIISISTFGDEERQTQNVSYDPGRRLLRIRRDQKVAKVIDGQHRIEGLRALTEENKPFETIITVLVDADLEQQAMMFATINKSQTKVHKSLVYDLFEFAENRSPEKSCHNIAVLLNQKENSPFKDRIKILGTADDASIETITQATFVESLLRHITNDPVRDRDFMRRHPARALPPVGKDDATRFVLRGLFASEQDSKIARTVWNLFEAVSRKWTLGWNSAEPGIILSRTTGFVAFMRLIRPIYVRFGCPAEAIPLSGYIELIDKVPLADEDFNSDRFLPGSTGQSALYRLLRDAMGLSD